MYFRNSVEGAIAEKNDLKITFFQVETLEEVF